MQRDNYISYRTTSVDCDVVVLSVTLFIVLFFLQETKTLGWRVTRYTIVSYRLSPIGEQLLLKQ